MAGGVATDAGMTNAGVDAGPLVDAGRVISVVDLDLFIQADGGTVAYPRQGELAAALFFLTDGGELRLTLDTDGGGAFSATHAPAGAWLAEVRRPAEPPVYLSVFGDRADLSQTRTSGRPGTALTQNLTLDFQLGVPQWEEGDSLELVSERAGSRLVVNPAAASGTTLVTDSLSPALVEGAVIEPSDDVLVSQLHSTTTDAGVVLTTVVAWSALSGLSIPGSPVVGTLTTPTQFGRISARLGSLTSALGSTPGSCNLAVYHSTPGATPLNAPMVLSATSSSIFMGDFTFQTAPVAHSIAQVDCQAEWRAFVPSIDGGVESDAAGFPLVLQVRSVVQAIDRISLDGGLAPEPTLTAPTSIATDNRFQPPRASVSPTISWTAQTGPLDRFMVVVYQLNSTGTRFTRTIVAVIHTQQTGVRLPLGLLVPGKAYFVTVQQTRAQTDSPLQPRYPIQRASRQSVPFLVAN